MLTFVRAASALGDLIRKNAEAIKEKNDEAIQHLTQTDSVVVQQSHTSKQQWRLFTCDAKTEEYCEIVFRMEGILVASQLVVGNNIGSFPTAKVANLSQRVKIVGLGCPSFNDALQQTKIVQAAFERHFGCPIAWNVGDELTDGFLNISANYLTRINGIDDLEVVAVGEGIDPFSTLSKFKAAGLVHTIDNVVKYYRKSVDANGAVIYDTIVPANFRIGDIVEARASATVVASKHGALKIHFHLHTLILHDAQFSKVRFRHFVRGERVKATPKVESKKRLRKLRAAIDEDLDVGEARKKLKQMSVSDDMDDVAA
ncbi:hypothetical protein B0H16DRAFT_1732714 [Mycena metata]|uniref:Uncharacterized protein n=1 Tax=Mycena metata TaxID=1033252 RepID=A0AAD7I101_9AGAR|nr:hypothetical protein B0H16DRAFT_1732714 [Mycena metata]